jgi:hypothetical protein
MRRETVDHGSIFRQYRAATRIVVPRASKMSLRRR